jgi:hypothetical protein
MPVPEFGGPHAPKSHVPFGYATLTAATPTPLVAMLLPYNVPYDRKTPTTIQPKRGTANITVHLEQATHPGDPGPLAVRAIQHFAAALVRPFKLV